MENLYFNNYFKSLSSGLNTTQYFCNNKSINPDYFFEEILALLSTLKEKKNKIFFFGNGASASFANHMALDFSKNGMILSRSLSDSALLTALSNDYSFEDAFVEFLKIENISKHDLVITISSSGNSSNIVNVLQFCNTNEIKTLSFSGLKKNNKSVLLSNYSAYVPMKTYGMVECIHQILLHLILDHSMDIREWEKVEEQNMSSKNFKI